MQPTTHPHDVRRRHVARRPLAVLSLILAMLAGVLTTGVTEAGATTATSVKVDRYGTRLGTTVVLDSSRKIHISVGDTRLPDGKFNYSVAGLSDRMVDWYQTTNPTTAAYRTHRNLKPGKLYFIQVYAQEPNGTWTQVVRNRVEMTKNRVVRVYWDKVDVIYDGDYGVYAGCGELSFRLQVEHRWGSQNWWNSPEYLMCDGRSYTKNWASPYITNNSNSLHLQAAVQDDDTAWNVLCTAAWGGCGDYWSASTTVPLPNEDNDGYMKSFTLPFNGIPNVTWHGRYWVGYV